MANTHVKGSGNRAFFDSRPMTDIEEFEELEAVTLRAIDIMRGHGVTPSQSRRYIREFVDVVCEAAQIEAELHLETCQRVNRMEFRP